MNSVSDPNITQEPMKFGACQLRHTLAKVSLKNSQMIETTGKNPTVNQPGLVVNQLSLKVDNARLISIDQNQNIFTEPTRIDLGAFLRTRTLESPPPANQDFSSILECIVKFD